MCCDVFFSEIYLTLIFCLYQEQKLCCKNKIFPTSYLKMKEVLMLESMKGGQVKRSDAQRLLKGYPSKVDVVFDLLLQMGWIQSADGPHNLKQF
mgnify:FL=1